MRENKRNHLVTIGIRGLHIKYYEKCLTQQNKKTPLLTCCCSLPLAALHPTKAVKSTFFFPCFLPRTTLNWKVSNTNLKKEWKLNKYSPIMNIRSAAFAVVNFDGKQAEEKEETGHSKTDFVHRRVSHQLLTHLTRLNALAHLFIEGKLENETHYRLLAHRAPHNYTFISWCTTDFSLLHLTLTAFVDTFC